MAGVHVTVNKTPCPHTISFHSPLDRVVSIKTFKAVIPPRWCPSESLHTSFRSSGSMHRDLNDFTLRVGALLIMAHNPGRSKQVLADHLPDKKEHSSDNEQSVAFSGYTLTPLPLNQQTFKRWTLRSAGDHKEQVESFTESIRRKAKPVS